MIRTRFHRRARLASVVTTLIVVLGAQNARAAPPATGGTVPPSASTPAGGDAAGEEASNHFKRGLGLFDEGDYTLALVEFERAYQLAPNYRALYNIALVDIQLGRYADAARTFEAYLRDGGDAIAPVRRTEVANTLAGLKLRTATVDISTNVPGAEVILDGKPLDASRLHGPMVIDAGEHSLRATAPGFQALNRTVTLAGADRATVRLDLVALALSHSETPARVRSPFWPGIIATGALGAGAIVSGVIVLEGRSHLSQLQNEPGSDAAQRESTANRVNTAALTADVLTGLAVVAGGVSLYLSFAVDHAAKSPSIAISPQRVVLSVPF